MLKHSGPTQISCTCDIKPEVEGMILMSFDNSLDNVSAGHEMMVSQNLGYLRGGEPRIRTVVCGGIYETLDPKPCPLLWETFKKGMPYGFRNVFHK